MALPQLVIDLQELKNYLKIDHSADDDLLVLLIESAKEHAEAYLNHDFTEIDEKGMVRQMAIPSSIKLACFKMINSWYDYRDDVTETKNVGGVSANLGEVPYDAEALMWKYRKLGLF